MDEHKNLRKWLKQRISEERYAHSLEVEKRAWALAEIHGENTGKAALAGLLHDCCNWKDKSGLLKIIESRGILLDVFTKAQPPLWHAIAGSISVQDELGIVDPDIISAIRYHTTGRAGMSKFEQIVYAADKTSFDRHYPDALKSRSLAEKSLEPWMLKALKSAMKDQLKLKLPIVSDTWEAYNYFWELNI